MPGGVNELCNDGCWDGPSSNGLAQAGKIRDDEQSQSLVRRAGVEQAGDLVLRSQCRGLGFLARANRL